MKGKWYKNKSAIGVRMSTPLKRAVVLASGKRETVSHFCRYALEQYLLLNAEERRGVPDNKGRKDGLLRLTVAPWFLSGDNDCWKQLQRVAQVDGVSISVVMRKALILYLLQHGQMPEDKKPKGKDEIVERYILRISAQQHAIAQKCAKNGQCSISEIFRSALGYYRQVPVVAKNAPEMVGLPPERGPYPKRVSVGLKKYDRDYVNRQVREKRWKAAGPLLRRAFDIYTHTMHGAIE